MNQLKIVIVGNTNNSPMQLAEGLQLLGHYVTLIVTRKELLHRPETRIPSYKQSYPSWILDFSHVVHEDIMCETSVIDDLIYHMTDGIDLAILNDLGPALANHLKCPHVAYLTGSDLLYYANFDSLANISSSWSDQFIRSIQGRRQRERMVYLVARQRAGIASARVICSVPQGVIPGIDRLLESMGVDESKRMSVHISNIHHLKPIPADSNQKLSILCGSRIVYRPDCNPALGPIDFKGTDILLRGFAEYIRRGGSGELLLIQKGQDVELARQLIKELDIGERVAWLDEMPMYEFYKTMSRSDIICDQFGSSVPGMVTTDAYALGRPVMCNFRNEIFELHYSEPFPGFNATTEEEIAHHLISIEQNPASLVEIGNRSRLYAEQYLAPEKIAERLLIRCGYEKSQRSLP